MALLFLRKDEILELHAKLIAEFGGATGLRDAGALESALIAAENREYYENADLPTCAATYAFHLTQAHAFIDGNKRIGAAAAELFIELNSARLMMSNEEVVKLFLDIAASRVSRDEVEDVLRQKIEATR